MRKAGGLDLYASGALPRPYGREKTTARPYIKRCGCNLPQTDLKTTTKRNGSTMVTS